MPDTITQVLLFALGVLGLYYGAEWLVRGAGRLARGWGVSALTIGLTVVAFGTSAPELAVGVFAALGGKPELALGNVVGSNVMNIALILGITALLLPIEVGAGVIRREIPVMILVTLATALFALDGSIDGLDAIMLLTLFAAYFWVVFRGPARGRVKAEAEYEELVQPGAAAPPRTWINFVLIGAGIAVMLVGARALVIASIFFARRMGLSEMVIGLTIVAVGTSLPELATALVAVWRKKSEIAVGNIVGSNVFNLCAILGVTALISPIPVSRNVLSVEFVQMTAISVVLLPLAWPKGGFQGIDGGPAYRLHRSEGLLLLGLYVLFALTIFVRAGRI
ncbi:MAG: calcium/sodium antiporter [Gemmatimonadota bacterium]